MTISKKVFTPSRSARLVPHWYSVDEQKLKRLGSISTRQLKLPNGSRTIVLDCPPVVVDPEGYIVNGKHRAIMSVARRQNLEAIIVETPNDILHHVPRQCYGPDEGDGPKRLIEALTNKDMYVRQTQANGVYTISDLVAKYAAFPPED